MTSDDHLGLREALRRRYFPHTAWQRCQTHYQQNAASKVLRRKNRGEVHDQLRDVFAAPDREQAQRRSQQMIDQWSHRLPEFAEWLEETLEQTLTVFQLPRRHRVRLRTTNNLEKLHQEVACRTRVVRIFPNRQSCLRLITALAVEQSEEWLTGSRYLTMTQVEPVNEKLVEQKEDVLQPVT